MDIYLDIDIRARNLVDIDISRSGRTGRKYIGYLPVTVAHSLVASYRLLRELTCISPLLTGVLAKGPRAVEIEVPVWISFVLRSPTSELFGNPNAMMKRRYGLKLGRCHDLSDSNHKVMYYHDWCQWLLTW